MGKGRMVGSKVNVREMGVGDGNGVLGRGEGGERKVIKEKGMGGVNVVSVEGNKEREIIGEEMMGEKEGGLWMGEIGVYDDEGVVIGVGKWGER